MGQPLSVILAEAASYREFLRDMIRGLQAVDGKFSYAQCAYLLGFQSRNAVRDIVEGRRRMTAATLRKLVSVCDKSKLPKQQDAIAPFCSDAARLFLQLSAEQLRLLEVLVYVEEPDLDPQGRTPAVLRALGGEGGASRQAIQQRTGLSLRQIDAVLQRLGEAQLVAQVEDRFVAVSQSIHLSNLANSEHFKVHFQNALRHALGRSQRHFEDPESLFLALHFSASKSRMTDLCQAIKALLIDFANQSEQPEGDCVVRLTLALTP